MNARPKVSVILPNYNYSRYLPERIDSILAQTFQDFELIILDDRSTDDSMTVIERYRNNPKVTEIVVNEINSGSPFKQWEAGVARSRGEYIWIAEADDTAAPTFLEKCVTMLDANPKMTLCMTMSNLIDSDGNPSTLPPFEDFEADGTHHTFHGPHYAATNLINVNACYNASMVVFRRSAWNSLENHNFARMRYCGDWLLWTMLAVKGDVGQVREKLNSFRKHGNSVTDSGTNLMQPYAESLTVKLYLMKANLLDPHYTRRTRYTLYRDLIQGRKKELLPFIERFDPDFRSAVKVSKRTYPLYWLYKHLFC